MILESSVRGFVIGLSVAAPVGPIGLLCIQRTLSDGRLTGFVSGLGAAAADGLYASVAAFGLSTASRALLHDASWVHLVGGAFLCLLGLRIALSRPAERAADAEGPGLGRAFGVTFLLTITNPMTILSFMAMFAGIQGGSDAGALAAALLVAGVLAGSATWWLLLSAGVGLLRHRLDAARLRWINALAGGALVVLGVLAAWRG